MSPAQKKKAAEAAFKHFFIVVVGVSSTAICRRRPAKDYPRPESLSTNSSS
jgi:hypothetical protein